MTAPTNESLIAVSPVITQLQGLGWDAGLTPLGSQLGAPGDLSAPGDAGQNTGIQTSGDNPPTSGDLPPVGPPVAAMAAPLQEPGLAGATALAVPLQKGTYPGAQDSATVSPTLSPANSSLQNVGSGPASSLFVDAVLGNLVSGSCAAAGLPSSVANPPNRRESLTAVQQLTYRNPANGCTPQGPDAGQVLAGSQVHATDSASSRLQNEFMMAPQVQAHASPSSASSLSPLSADPAPTQKESATAGAGLGSDSSHKNPMLDAGSARAPASNSNSVQNKDSATPNSSSADLTNRVVSATADVQPAALQPILAQMPATAVPGDAVRPLESTQTPSSAPKPDTANAASTTDSSNSTPMPGEAATNPAVGPVQMAQMVSRAAQSEMRIGLTTSAFGTVEVRTQVRANEVGLAIGSEKGDLRSLLANEIPGLATRLQQQSLRLGQVNFHQSSASSGSSSSEGNSQRRFFAQSARVHSSGTESAEPSSALPGITETSRSRHAGLSVLA
ncbi:MAG TPA: flagellar hook-length control protein FliK [Terriglobales bacterium]|nr:flagellar hook-length control protein FliK [Terriglobales bacterium]